jgi:hypothetical protein
VKKPVSRSTTRKVGGGAGCGSEKWVWLPLTRLTTLASWLVVKHPFKAR